MVFVSVSETYDLSTKQGRMSLIGIHTPTQEIIQKTYPGLLMNSKFCRIVKQDVALACASAMPFSAEIIGTGADDIAPEDAFNPILYKAVSNDSMSTIEARLWGLNYQSHQTNTLPTFHGAQVVAENENAVGMVTDDFGVYYSLLSNHAGFKTANPQQGLVMKNLVPLVFEKYYNGGVNSVGSDNQPALIEEVGDADDIELRSATPVSSMRGKAHPMPRFNTTFLTGLGTVLETDKLQNNGMGDGHPRNSQAKMPSLMPVYTACIIMPPSRLHSLFYRLVVRTTLEFTEVRPIQEISSFAELDGTYAPVVYHSDYTYQSSKMTATAGMVDAKDAEITKIMEGA